jgi:hypothetical protein
MRGRPRTVDWHRQFCVRLSKPLCDKLARLCDQSGMRPPDVFRELLGQCGVVILKSDF